MRHPVSAFPWHGDECGILVVADDGSLWRWCEEGTWELRGALPGSPAESYGLPGELPTDVVRRCEEHSETTP